MSRNSNLNTQLKIEEAYGIPLMELDRTVIEDTYCMIDKRWGQTFVYRYSRLPTLYLFHPYSNARRAAIALTTHVCYDICLIIIVLANLTDLAIPHSLPLLFERVAIIFYIIETVYVTIARGFIFGSYAYLKNPWMCTDFIITLLSMPDLELNKNAEFGIQSLRGIRILNLISKMPGVQIMAQGIILSMFRMYGVAVIIFLFLLSVSLTAKQLFMGIFRRRCVKDLPFDFDSLNISYFDYINNPINWDTDQHNDYVMCGNITGSQKCEIDYTCLVTDGQLDHTSFDTFSLSLLNSFRLLTQDEWESIYDSIIKAAGSQSFFFFLPVIFLGSFFLLNLMLVVVTSTYDFVTKKKEANQPLKNFKYHSSFPFDVQHMPLYPLPTSPSILRRVFKERDEILVHQLWFNKTWQKVKDIMILKSDRERTDYFEDLNSSGEWKKFRILCRKVADNEIFHYFILITIILNIVLLASENANNSNTVTNTLKYLNVVITAIFALETTINLIACGKYFFLNWWNIWDLVIVSQSLTSIIFNLAAEYSIFRSLRLLELVKVQQAWPALHKVISIVLGSIKSIIQLLAVMSLIIFTFAVIGNKLLGSQIKPNVELERWSFTTFGGSLFTVFKIFAGEWYIPLSDCLATSKKPYLCVIVIIPFFVIGYLVILSVFTAVLLSAFDAASLQLPTKWKKKKKSTIEENPPNDESTNHQSKLTQILQYFKMFVRSSKFENLVFVIVIASCITMAFEDVELESNAKKKYIVESLNIVFTIIFAVEAVLRWLAIGINRYFDDSWMRFDFILIMLSLVELFVKYSVNLSEHAHLQLKALRVLRPLRVIPRCKNLQLVAYSLVISLPSVFHVTLVVLFIWLPFAILGVHFFAGKFFRCVDEYHHRVTEEHILNKTDCLEYGYQWDEMFYNFNHIGNSYLSLFQLAMFTGWTELVEMMVDFNVEDLQPVNDNRSEYYAFVVIFVFLGAFFSLNLFVGVVVDTFKNSHKDVKMGKPEILLTDAQRRYYAAMLKLGKKQPMKRTDKPSNKFLNVCYSITYSLWFRVLILIFISTNSVTIALDCFGDSPRKKIFLQWCDNFFTASYSLELIIKILGLRKFYFNDFWNIFDFLLVSSHIIGNFTVPFDAKTESNPLSFLYAFRLLRVLRLLRLTDMVIDLRRLLHAMVASIPALINISILLFTIVYIYSIFGMSFFGHLNYHGVITSKLNFRTFLQSYLLLFRLTTAQGWEGLLESLSIQPPFCSLEEGTCGNFVISAMFVLSFIVISNIILVNIFIAVILENYVEAVMQENEIINDDSLDNFYSVWKDFDPKATQFISYKQLSDFLNQLNKHMRIPKPNHIAIAYMNLPLVDGDKIHCLNVLQGILLIKAGEIEDSATFRILCDQARQRYEGKFPKLKKLQFVATTMQLKQKDFAARIIQTNLRKFRARKKLKVV